MDSVRVRRPRYVVWVQLPEFVAVTGDTNRSIFEEARRLVERNYSVELVAFENGPLQPYTFLADQAATRWLERTLRYADMSAFVALFRRDDADGSSQADP